MEMFFFVLFFSQLDVEQSPRRLVSRNDTRGAMECHRKYNNLEESVVNAIPFFRQLGVQDQNWKQRLGVV